ncbi:MAG: HEAT repeat domain-containing protein [bacterium]|nr:HEAT repeat domain-containing protein [bacterium]
MITAESSQALQSSDEDVRLQALIKLDAPNTAEDTETLVAILADQSWRVRKAAVQILAKTEIDLVVPFLIKALSVGNIGLQNVRFHNSALECLTEIGHLTIPYLTTALQDPDKDVRIAAANVLGTIRHHDACDALIEALHDEHINVRYAVVEALSRIPSQKSVIPLTQVLEHDEDWLKLPAISALGHIGDYRATPYLMKIAGHPLFLQTVVEALGNVGDEDGIPCIIDALESTDKEIRKTAVMSMEHMARKLDKFHAIIQQPSTYHSLFRSACTEPVMLNLVEFMDDNDFNLVVAAIKLLGWSGQQDAAYALLEHLENEQYQEVVVSALFHIGENAITPLDDAYEHSRSLDTQLLIIDCLREIGGEHALKILLAYLQKGGEELIIYALLKSFTSPSLNTYFLTAENSPYFETVLRHAKHYLESTHPLVRAEAVALWGMLRGEKVLDDLLNATKDVDPRIRIKAIEHLGNLIKHRPGILEHLTMLFSDDHPGIRKQVAYALGNAVSPNVFPALLLVLDDSNPLVQRAAVVGLAQYLERHPDEEYRQRVLEKIREVLEHRCRRYEDGLLKIEICRTLEHIESAQSKELLLKLSLDVDFDVRKKAILALGSFRSYTESLVPILLKFLEDTHWSVREAAVTALGLLGTDQVEAELFDMLQDPDITVQKALLVTMGRIGSPKVIPTLIEYLAHDELDDSSYQGLAILAERYREQVLAYEADENPKVHLYLKHILEQH